MDDCDAGLYLSATPAHCTVRKGGKMARDAQRFRKTYSFQRPEPRFEVQEAAAASEMLPVKALIHFHLNPGEGARFLVSRKVPADLDVNIVSTNVGYLMMSYPTVVDLSSISTDAIVTAVGGTPLQTSVSFGEVGIAFYTSDGVDNFDTDFVAVFY